MDFWGTFWATMWGALAGAAFGAFVSWLFSLDLRRRSNADRKAESEADYRTEIRRQWASLVPLLRQWAHTEGAIAERVDDPDEWAALDENLLNEWLSSLTGVYQAILNMLAIATGDDFRALTALGVMQAHGGFPNRHKVEKLDEALRLVVDFTSTDVARHDDRLKTLVDSLESLQNS